MSCGAKNPTQQDQLVMLITLQMSSKTWALPHLKNSNHQFQQPIIISRKKWMIGSSIATAAESDEEENRAVSAGRIKRLVLPKQGRSKLNNFPDRQFYSYPRFVNHVDDAFISTLTNVYREILRPEMEILDLMSSWVSHLPDEVKYRRVVGHGLNAQELARNPRLDYFFVKDLNEEQELEFENDSFDAVLCSVSVQYLQQPEKVFGEIWRILKPGGVFIVSFSNRLFYEKAISSWREGTAYSRVQLVVQYFQCVQGFMQPQVIRRHQNDRNHSGINQKSIFSEILGMLGLIFSRSSDPFYAVISYKNFKPLYLTEG